MNNIRPLNILVVDDHPLYRKGVCNMFSEYKNILTKDEAVNGMEAIKLLKKKHYDIVFLDIEMPVMNGIDTSQIILKKFPKTKIIILTGYDSRRLIHELKGIGVHGFILKTMDKKEAIHAIKTILDGSVYLTPKIQSLWNNYSTPNFKLNNIKSKVTNELTKREIQIIEEICEQNTSIEIAEKLSIAKTTVDNHRRNIMKKLKTDNLVAIVIFAIRNGIYNIKYKIPSEHNVNKLIK